MILLNMKRIFLALFCVFTLSAVFSPQAQAQNCECAMQYVYPSGCIPPPSSSYCTDLTIFTCATIAASHAATIASLSATITAGFTAHELFMENFWMRDGIIAALAQYAEQVSVGHMDQTQKLANFNTTMMQQEVQRRMQINEVKSKVNLAPSEESCQFATMTGGLAASNAQADSKMLEDLDFLTSNALGESNSVLSSPRESTSARTDVMCRYADDNLANGALEAVCSDDSPNDTQSSKMLLAVNLQQESMDDSYREPVHAAMMSMFMSDRPQPMDRRLFANDNVKIAYMDHRSVVAREMLAAYCFRKSFKDKIGGDDNAVDYQAALYEELGLDPAEALAEIGSNPSSYAQKKLLAKMVMDPTFGVSAAADTETNILALANGVQAQKMALTFDTLQVLHCNELIMSQLLVNALEPVSSDLQERIDVIEARLDAQDRERQFAGQDVLKTLEGGAL